MGTAATTPALPLPPAVNRRLDAIDPRLVLAAAMVVCTGLIFWLAGDRIFAIDEWEYVVNRGEWTVENILRPANAHLLAVPLIFYKALLSIFGAESHLPFTILSVVLHLGTVTLVYVLLARRLGEWLALLPALLLLFYGAGWEVMINTAAMQNQFGIIAGLGMLLCLDRRDRRGDVAAGVLLTISMASFTIGLAFAAAAAVRIVADRIDSRRTLGRLVLVAVPVALYAAWYLWARQFDQSNLSLYSVGSLPSGVFDQLSAIGAGITGVFRPTGAPDIGDSLALIDGRTALLAFGLIVLLILRLRLRPLPDAAAWSGLALFVAYLVLIAIGLDEAREPNASRYVYMGTVLLLVCAGGLLAGVRVGRGWLLGACLILAVSLIANVAQIRAGGKFFEEESTLNEAELAALELSRETVSPDYVLEADFPHDVYPHRDLLFPARDYFEMTERFGSPALSEAELAATTEEARELADEIFLGIGAITVAPGAPPAGEAEPPAVTDAINAEVETGGRGCVTTTAADPGPHYVVIDVPPGGFSFESDARPSRLALRRYSSGVGIDLAPTGGEGTVAIGADASPRPWQALFALDAPTEICSLGDAG